MVEKNTFKFAVDDLFVDARNDSNKYVIVRGVHTGAGAAYYLERYGGSDCPSHITLTEATLECEYVRIGGRYPDVGYASPFAADILDACMQHVARERATPDYVALDLFRLAEAMQWLDRTARRGGGDPHPSVAYVTRAAREAISHMYTNAMRLRDYAEKDILTAREWTTKLGLDADETAA